MEENTVNISLTEEEGRTAKTLGTIVGMGGATPESVEPGGLTRTEIQTILAEEAVKARRAAEDRLKHEKEKRANVEKARKRLAALKDEFLVALLNGDEAAQGTLRKEYKGLVSLL